jgi:hypothetical protein
MSVPQQMVSGQYPAWHRKLLFDIEETMRLAKSDEQFYVISSPLIPLLALQALPNQIVTNGLTDDFVILQILTAVGLEFTFNFKILGSQQYYFTNQVDCFQFALQNQPYALARPILLKAGNGIMADFTNIINGASTVQLAFAGYRAPQGKYSS